MARMSMAQIAAFTNALLSVAMLKNEADRTLCVEEIEAELGRDLDLKRRPNAKADLLVIVRALEKEDNGLHALLLAVVNLGDEASVRPARRVLATFELEQLLAGVDTQVTAEAAAAVLGARVEPGEPAAILQQVGWQPAAAWGVPAALAFASVLGAGMQMDGTPIQHWITSAAYDLGLSGADLDKLRAATDTYWATARAGSTTTVMSTVKGEGESQVPTTIIIGEQAPSRIPTLVLGGVPPRNPFFTGRHDSLIRLDKMISSQLRASVLPKASVQGAGGVGKTQLAVEFTYLHQSRYQIIWWINAENLSTVRTSLSALADRLSIPPSAAMDQRIRTLLDHLATTPQNWLLVYDNAADPGELAALMPSANLVGDRGHVIVTTRDAAWTAEGAALELDVFTRAESVELLHRRVPDTSDRDADLLADKLDDLPLALEQAASWLLTTPSSVDEYMQDLDRHAYELLAEGRPREYSGTVLTVVSLALPKLAERSPAALQLLELLAHLAPEPVPTRLLWEGRAADVPEPLRSALQERTDMARATRHLGALGLARIDTGNKRVQVHRLVHLVVREGLTGGEALANAQRLLAAANPGFPDERRTWLAHADITPHLLAARMVHGDVNARRTVLDQVRYLYVRGDFESCRALAENALTVWDVPGEDGQPAGDSLTLLALRRYADALRALGDPQAAPTAMLALERMRESLGEEHEYTMGAANSVGADLRRAGDITAARELDARNLEMHRRILSDADPSTLRVMNSLAMDLRLTGDFDASYALNVEVEQHARALEDGAIAIVLAQEAQARDLYLLGRYADAAALLDISLPAQRELLGPDHLTVLRATCVHTACLRKVGRLDEAAAEGEANYREVTRRFSADHIMAAEAGMTAANALRARGDAREAHSYATRSVALFREIYGPAHPVVLCASINLAAILRLRELDQEAYELNERTLAGMNEALPPTHPYLLSARTGQVMNLVRAHRLAEAQPLSYAIMEDSQRIRGPQHAYTLYCMVNAAVDLIQTRQPDHGLPLLAEATELLRQKFGDEHPEVVSGRNHRRIECDIETISLA